MERYEGGYTNRVPIFNGIDYVFWKVRMKTYIQSLGVDVWDVVEEDCQNPPTMITKYHHNMEFTCNAKAMNPLLVSLTK